MSMGTLLYFTSIAITCHLHLDFKILHTKININASAADCCLQKYVQFLELYYSRNTGKQIDKDESSVT